MKPPLPPTPEHVYEQLSPRFDPQQVLTPSYIVDLGLLRDNLIKLHSIQEQTGAKILLALKGFSMFATFPLIREYLSGCCASGIHEALLGAEEFRKELHVYSPAFKDQELQDLLPIADHLSFNSPTQWLRFKDQIQQHNQTAKNKVSPGLRINPEHAEVEVDLYNPCSPSCRLGTRAQDILDIHYPGLEGLHFHALCEQNSDVLERTLQAVEQRFPRLLKQVKWVNMGGGHHITRSNYDLPRLIRILNTFRDKHNVQIYLEPGEAVALNTGYLVASVVDIVPTSIPTAILDTSATAHMPDTLEMPYRPHIVDTGKPEEKLHHYQLGGLTCLAGDVIGHYSFDQPLSIGDKLIFTDMAHYTMVKTSTFNGVPHPSISTYDPITQKLKIIKSFGYKDFKDKLS
jgi:carboxynorspermidine decarboxylase